MTALAAALFAGLTCVPGLPFFCGNIHVGCAGRTTVPTQAFVMDGGQVEFADGAVWTVSGEEHLPTVLRRDGHRDWIRIEADGRFSQRLYRRGRAMMTRGRCSAAAQG